MYKVKRFLGVMVVILFAGFVSATAPAKTGSSTTDLHNRFGIHIMGGDENGGGVDFLNKIEKILLGFDVEVAYDVYDSGLYYGGDVTLGHEYFSWKMASGQDVYGHITLGGGYLDAAGTGVFRSGIGGTFFFEKVALILDIGYGYDSKNDHRVAGTVGLTYLF